MKKFLAGALITLMVLLLTVLLVISWTLSSKLLYPKSNCRVSHYIYCKGPDELSLDFEEVEFKTSDDVLLSGWFIPAKGSSKTIIMIHGHGGSRLEGLRFTPALHQAGYNVLLYDSRIFSKGSKAFASMGYHEQKDVKAAIAFVLSRNETAKIGILGYSMGAATGILTMAGDNRIAAGVFSSSYASVVDELSDVGRRDFGIPDFPLLTMSIAVANLRGNMNLYDVIPEDAIARISPRPVLIMHCDGDDYIDYNHALRVYNAAKEPKEMWTASCNGHERVWNSDPEKAESVVVSFFDRHLR